MTDTKSSVLNAIRQALAKSVPEAAGGSSYNRQPKPNGSGTEPVLQHFVQMLDKVGGEGHILDGEEAAISVLRGILGAVRGQGVLFPPDSELERLGLQRLQEESSVRTLRMSEITLEEAAEAALGITTAQAGIADTGTVVLLHTEPRGRLAALLAPMHVVFLKKNVVYPDKITFLDQARQGGLDLAATPMTWVTGPSLTADIEKVLVRGAHGPHRVVVLLY